MSTPLPAETDSEQTPVDTRTQAAEPALTVWYDGDCPICAREIGFYRRRAGAAAIRWVNLRDAGGPLPPGSSREAALGRLNVQRPDGTLHDGVQAFRALWSALPALRWAAVLTRPRPMQQLLAIGYAAFLRWRPAPAARTDGAAGRRGR